MFYKKFKPRHELSFYIECYYVWEGNAGNTVPLKVESPPPAFTSIVFNYGDDYFVSTVKLGQQKVPRQFIVGQNTFSYTLHLPGKIGMAGIVFRPTGMAAILHVPMFALTEERIDLRVFIPSNVVEVIAQNIAEEPEAGKKSELLEEFIYDYYIRNEPVPDAIDHAANIIVEKHGQVNINELCSQLFISRRHFERKFLEKVGLSAKYYARLRRIGFICSQIAGKRISIGVICTMKEISAISHTS